MRIDDLPIEPRVVEILKRDGIVELYPPQADVAKYIFEGKNILLAVPTAAGKSLVAYLAILHDVLNGGKAMYIVPLRALATEKFEDLRKFEPLGITVALSMGDYDSSDYHLGKYDVIVTTSEKADSLLRHNADWLRRITTLVADEIHLLNDPDRGPTLEVTITKFKMINPSVRIVGLSATISNSEDIAKWLDAVHYRSDWRPVPLKLGVYDGDYIEFLDGDVKIVGIDSKRKDKVVALVEDAIADDGQCLVFVNTRRSSESVARRLAKHFGKRLSNAQLDALADLVKSAEEPTVISEKLAECIRHGVAFHNAGLTNRLRKIVEDGFRRRFIKCIVATPTLAAGINLPARRVVIRDTHRYEAGTWMRDIPVLEIQQMCGRAGRPGYDPYGEALIVVNEKNKEYIVKKYLMGEPEPINSKLGAENALRSHILALIATNTANTREGIMEFMSRTFFAMQSDIRLIESVVDEILDFLIKHDFIEENGEFKSTQFGKKTTDLYIDPLSAVKIRDALIRGDDKTLGLLHAVCYTPDMPLLILRSREIEEVWREGLARRCELIFDLPAPFEAEYEFYLGALKVALMLEYWINEFDEDHIIKRFDIWPGDLRSRIEVAEWLLYSMRELARLFRKELFGTTNALMLRVRHGVKEELLPLVSLRGIGRRRARALYSQGFRDIEDIARASVEDIARVPGIGEKLARGIKQQAENIYKRV